MGARLYVTETDVVMDAGLSDEWDDVGEISDIIIGNQGGIDAVLADIGGFLGMGERTIAVNMDDLKFVSDGPDADDYFVVLTGTQAQLEAAPEFDNDFVEGRTRAEVNAERDAERTMGDAERTEENAERTLENAEVEVEEAGDAVVTTTARTVEESENAVDNMADGAAGMMSAPMMERDGYQLVDNSALTTEELTGTSVYGTNDERIGEVGELLMTDDGKLDKAIIDVGGFLGLGEKPVAVSMDSLTILRADGDTRVYIDATEEQLESMPDYEY
jgi:sporulation protein YlmC with PRC-barrel domain